MLKPKKLEQYENLLRKIRCKLHLYDEKKNEKALRIIEKIKALCAENWEERHRRNDPRNKYAEMMWM